jgi:4-coumarate--CoA ligase
MAFVVLSAPAVACVQADPAEAARIKAALVRHVADVKIAYKHLAGGVQFVDDIPKNPRCVPCTASLTVCPERSRSGKLLRRVLREKAKAVKATTGRPPAKL